MVKKLKIFHPFILGKIDKKKVFYDILDRTKPFGTIKRRSSKTSKNLHLLILIKIGKKKVFFDILESKRGLSRLQKQGVSKVEKLALFQRG